jgi:prophage DNA circulation protein
MNKFGILKAKLLKKITESYSSQNKTEVKNILNTIKENRDFKEMYLFYEDIENKYFDDQDTAKLFVEEVNSILKNKIKSIEGFCNSLNEMVKDINADENEIYTALDQLAEGENLSNIDKKVIAKKKLVSHLTTKKAIAEGVQLPSIQNESLLYAVLANNFNVLYNNTLNEEAKGELKEILALSQEDVATKVTELSENILNKVDTMLQESTYTEVSDKLNQVKKEVQSMDASKYNYYRLKQLENGLI